MSAISIEAGRAFVRLFLKDDMTRKLKRALSGAATAMRDTGRAMTAAGTAIAGAGIAAATPFALATKTFADFDDAMRAVQAVTQSNDQQFAALTTKAKALGASTSFTAVQVASLMTELGRAGFTAEQIEQMTGAVLDLSRATGTDATIASGIMAASIRQFGLGATEATRVSDALTVAANKSFNTVELLGEALSYAGPVAADFGMSIEDTLAILGGLGNVGIQGSNAGTAIRRLLTLGGAEAEKLQGIFGVAFTDAAGNARPLIDTLAEVNEATKDLGTAERAAKFNEAFGLLGITGASAIGKSAVDIRALRDALGEAEGAANKAAVQMDAGLGGSFRIIMSAVEGLAIEIGQSLAPVLNVAVKASTELLGRFNEWIQNNRSLVAAVAAVTAGVIAAGVAIAAIGAAIFTAGTALSTVMTVLGVLTSPLTIVSSLLAGGVFAWAKYSQAGQRAMSAIGGALASFSGTAKSTLAGVYDAIASGDFAKAGQIAITGLRIVVLRGVSALASSIGGTWGDIIGTIGAQLTGGDFAGAWQTVVSGMGAIWASFTEGIVSSFGGAIHSVLAALYKAHDAITDFILQDAAKGGFFGTSALAGTGVDVKAEIARREKMKGGDREATAGRIAQNEAALTFANSDGEAGFRKQLDQLRTAVAEARAAGNETLAKTLDAQRMAAETDVNTIDQEGFSAFVEGLKFEIAEAKKQLGGIDLAPGFLDEAKAAAREINAQNKEALDAAFDPAKAAERTQAAIDNLKSGTRGGASNADEIKALEDELASLRESASVARAQTETATTKQEQQTTDGAMKATGSGNRYDLGPTFSAAAAMAAGFTGANENPLEREERQLGDAVNGMAFAVVGAAEKIARAMDTLPPATRKEVANKTTVAELEDLFGTSDTSTAVTPTASTTVMARPTEMKPIATNVTESILGAGRQGEGEAGSSAQMVKYLAQIQQTMDKVVVGLTRR